MKNQSNKEKTSDIDQSLLAQPKSNLAKKHVMKEQNSLISARRKADTPIFRSRLVYILNLAMTIFVVTIALAGAIIYWGKYEFEAKGPLTESSIVQIDQGFGLYQISQLLAKENIIESFRLFVWAVRVYQNEDKLQAGEYRFEPGVSMRSVMDDLVSGKAVTYDITIPEGWTSQQIVEKINLLPKLKGEIVQIPPEGSLMPETYQYKYGQTRNEIIGWMKEAHEKALAEVWANRDPKLPLKTPAELLILASLVEKETTQVGERGHVAGVFINRLKKPMRLQSDPTILYGVYRGDAWSTSRTILQTEKDQKNEYNTYKIDGLPPGPIANVGRAALEAVANPYPTKDLYFVADGSGGHAFAETYDEHKINVAKWRKIERERKDAEKVEN